MKIITSIRTLGAIAALIFLSAFTDFAGAQTFITIDDPALSGSTAIVPAGTYPRGVDGDDVVGTYIDSTYAAHGFLYNGTGYTTYPSLPVIRGISGQNLVGYFMDADNDTHGFFFNGKTIFTLDDPLASEAQGGTNAEGISVTTTKGGLVETNVVGIYADSNGHSHGFIYGVDSFGYITLDDPDGVGSTFAYGIYGGTVVGLYRDSNGSGHGFVYRNGDYTTLDDPDASAQNGGTGAYGISGSDIVGWYRDNFFSVHGFLFDGTTYTELDDPLGVNGTFAYGTSGTVVVGNYVDSNDIAHGFMYANGPPPTPSAPPRLTAVAGNTQVRLAWATVAWATSYDVYRGTVPGGESSTPIAVGVVPVAYTNVNLTNGRTYYYTVAAVDSSGTSAYTNEAHATPTGPLAAPTGLSAVAGNAEVTLRWDPTFDATSYKVFRKTSAGSETVTAVATGVTGTKYTNSGLANGTEYFYVIKAVDAVSTSDYSSVAQAVPTTPPTNLTATAGNSKVALAWTLCTGATGYRIYRGTAAGAETSSPITTSAKGPKWTDTHVINGHTYYYKVDALYDAAISGFSNEAHATPTSSSASRSGPTELAGCPGHSSWSVISRFATERELQ